MSMKTNVTIFLVLFLSLSGIAQSINSSKSEVIFEIGNLGFNTVEGKFKKMSGEVTFNPNNLSRASFDVCVSASTIDTNSRKRDEHLKNEDFFHVEKYPKICFKSQSVSRKDDGYLVKGKLTMHGVTKNVEIPFSHNENTFIGTLTVNRYDYNLGSQTSKFMVSEEAEIQIVCVTN